MNKKIDFSSSSGTKILTKNRKLRDDSFHNAVKPVIVVAQIMGLMPVSGILSANVRVVKFDWLSFRVIWWFIVIAGYTFEAFFSVIQITELDLSLGTAGPVVFYSVCTVGNFCIFILARNWPKMIRYWRQVEDIFLKYPYQLKMKKLSTKIRIMSFTLLFVSAMEHMLSIIAGINKTLNRIKMCNLQSNFFESFYMAENKHIFKYIKYDHLWILPLQFLTISMTFCWNFIDLLIIIVSLSLAHRFNQINVRLLSAKEKIMPDSFWIEIRNHYFVLCELLLYIDKQFSAVILIACSSDLYFICAQLFNSFHEIPSVVSRIYFWLSLIYVMIRTLLMLFSAASINDASRKPLAVLKAVPTNGYSIEVQRFSSEVAQGLVALSGRRFFYLTRTLILAMAGTVATYELVLLDRIEEESVKKQYCNNESSLSSG